MYLYQSNKLEVLFSTLCRILTTPLNDPLAPEIIVVQNQGMARWLAQQFATQTGIAANLAFPLPARFIYDVFTAQRGKLPDQSPFDRNTMLWRIYQLLPELCRAEKTLFAQPNHYLGMDNDARKQLQLARKISDLFDQYLVFRPDMLTAWESGNEHHWQAELWRQLTRDHNLHRGRLLEEFHQQVEKEGLKKHNMPERVSLFGLSTLAPAYMELFARIGLDVPIHLLHLCPCQVFWEDILPERSLAKKRKQWRHKNQGDISDTFTHGNPLLASMGTIGRTFFQQLMALEAQDTALYEHNQKGNLLARLQNDILDLHDRTQERTSQSTIDRNDISIQFHLCHSPLREVQVLHDRLLEMFANKPSLTPADIVVMAPDISSYAPYIDGVFSAVDHHHRIPWTIADRTLQDDHPAGRLFLELMDLLSSRCTAPEVLALVDNPLVYRRFGLTADGPERLRNLVRKSGIRWALDQEQRNRLGLDESNLSTWSFGRDRLLLSYSMGGDAQMFAGIAPFTANVQPETVGSLSELIHQLSRYRKRLHQSYSPDQWCLLLTELVQAFFMPEQDDDILPLYQAISDFGQHCSSAGLTEPLEKDVIRSYFEQLLSEPGGGQAFLAGQVTFCNMVPMRSIPFKVICLLGMSDTDFPRSTRPPAFDLMAQSPRLGDRNRRDDDRYLFLEALLSAREVLYISWMGRSQQENSEIQPSVVVSELQDYINLGFSASGVSPCDQLTRNHPLQPFSRRCFDSTPGLASYNQQWMPAEGTERPKPFLEYPLPEPGADWSRVDICQLAGFWSHPVRFFLQKRLGLQLFDRETTIEENEPFALDALERYMINQDAVNLLLADCDTQEVYARQQAAGLLPHGPFAQNQFRKIAEIAEGVATLLRSLLSAPQLPMDIELILGRFLLTGRIDHLFGQGRISWRAAQCKGKDLLKLWLFHLGLHLAQPGSQIQSFHLATDGLYELTPVQNPERILLELMDMYWQGLSTPLHFYPETSFAFARAQEDRKMKAAFNTWNGNMKMPGEQEDRAYTIALCGALPLDEAFTELASTIISPLLDHLQIHEAA